VILTVAFALTVPATAYGLAVTGTFLLTTAFSCAGRSAWHWRPWQLVLTGARSSVVWNCCSGWQIHHGGARRLAALLLGALVSGDADLAAWRR